MSEETQSLESPKVESKSRGGLLPLGDTLLLALYTAMSYGTAYAFEVGVAEYFGYPRWLIRLDVWDVLLAFGALLSLTAVLAFIVFLFFFLVGARIKAKTIPMLLSTFRATFGALFGIGGSILVYNHWKDSEPALVLRAIQAFIGLFVSVFLVDITHNLWVVRKRNRGQLSRFEYWEEAISKRRDEISARRKESDRRDTLLERIVPGSFTATAIGLIMLTLPLMFFLALVSGAGRFVAGQRPTFLVSNDSPPLIALRRYGDYMVVALPDTSGNPDQRSFRILSLSDVNDRTWSRKSVVVEGVPDHASSRQHQVVPP